METTFRIPNREIAMAAFESLRHEGKKDAALKLAGALLCSSTRTSRSE